MMNRHLRRVATFGNGMVTHKHKKEKNLLTPEDLVSLSGIHPAPTFVFVREWEIHTLESIVWHFTQKSIALGIDSGLGVPNIVRLIRVRELPIAPSTEGSSKQFGGRHPITGIHVRTDGHDTLEILNNEFVHVVSPAPDIGLAFGIVGTWGNSHLVVILLLVDNGLSVDGGHGIPCTKKLIFIILVIRRQQG
jgi:hypothetical protein